MAYLGETMGLLIQKHNEMFLQVQRLQDFLNCLAQLNAVISQANPGTLERLAQASHLVLSSLSNPSSRGSHQHLPSTDEARLPHSFL